MSALRLLIAEAQLFNAILLNGYSDFLNSKNSSCTQDVSCHHVKLSLIWPLN